jgi:hypothetical protein
VGNNKIFVIADCARRNGFRFFLDPPPRLMVRDCAFPQMVEFVVVQSMHPRNIKPRGGAAIATKSHGNRGALEVRSSRRRKTKEAPGTAYCPEPTLVCKAEAEKWETKGFRHGAISVFILFHLIAILCWTVPTDSPLVAGMRGLVGPYMQWTGLSQSWDTFAPNPKSVNAYIKAVVISQHGHMHVFAFPRMEQVSFGERYRKERYRKFAENMAVADNVVILPDIVRHVARLYQNPADPPDKVVLVQFRADITPWAKHDQRPRPVVFYQDYVEPEDPR